MNIKLPINYRDKDFEKEFPNWYSLAKSATAKTLSLKDITRCTGLTPRQVAYWIQKEILPTKPTKIQDTRSWRWFSILELFIFAVAKAFRSRGIEFTTLPSIQRQFFITDMASNFFVMFYRIINGKEVFLYSDFDSFDGMFPIAPQEEDCIKDNSDFFELTFNVPKGSGFVVIFSLKKICDELARKLDLPDFKVNIKSNGRYEFTIKGVPLKLESLEINGEDDLNHDVR
ncbi:MAG: hypothetical protein K8R45_11980 [Desulfobacterales bacterium]|nr:hypothetical protein [Desulfobacterales bacterium]